jgi:hypothetical protein
MTPAWTLFVPTYYTTAQIDNLIATNKQQIFANIESLNTYLQSGNAVEGQIISVKIDGKNKAYIITYDNGVYDKKPISGNSMVLTTEIGETIADVINELTADEDTDYYIGNTTDGFIHYRYINDTYIAVGGDSYTKEEIDNLVYTQSQIDTLLTPK